MNLKLILIVSLLVLIFTSLLVFGFIAYDMHSSQATVNDYFKASSWWFYGNLGVELGALLVAGLLFIKR